MSPGAYRKGAAKYNAGTIAEAEMDRRAFLELLAAAPLASAARAEDAAPRYRVVSRYPPAAVPGMPGPWPGRVVSVRSPRCLDEGGRRRRRDRARDDGPRHAVLDGRGDHLGARRRFFQPQDVVGIKVNAGGVPHVVSNPAIVAETCRQLMAVGIPATSLVVFERFQNQIDGIGYPAYLPEGVQVFAAEAGNRRMDNRAYDPATYVEVDFFGERTPART